MDDLDPDAFEEAVAEVVAGLPAELAHQIRNVSFRVEDGTDPHLLGLYRGVALTRRGADYAGVLPDTITIYRLPILALCRTRAEALAQIEVTVKHEIGHYFGIDDDRLHELGFG